MQLLKSLAIKKELREMFERAGEIYNQADNSLQPVRNVYFHYTYLTMGYIKSGLDVSMEDIENSLTMFSSCLNMLLNIKNKCNKIIELNPNFASKFHNEIYHFDSHLNNFKSKIYNFIIDIKKFEDYRYYRELVYIIEELQHISRDYGFKLHNSINSHNMDL